MLFIFALPVMQVILFCLAIGRDPTGLKLAVANMEMNGTVRLPSKAKIERSEMTMRFYFQDCFYEKGCHFTGLSCRYLDHLNSSILKEYYPDPESAIQAVRDGNAWGAIYFTENFTDSLLARMALGNIIKPNSMRIVYWRFCGVIHNDRSWGGRRNIGPIGNSCMAWHVQSTDWHTAESGSAIDLQRFCPKSVDRL